MKIGIQSWGSDGDIRPFAALAGGLSKAGHNVTLAVTSVDKKDYTALSKSLNFEIRHLDTSKIENLTNVGKKVLKDVDPLSQLNTIMKTAFDPVYKDIVESAEMLCEENDILIGHFLVYPLTILANKNKKPHIAVSTVPFYPSKYTSPIGAPYLGKLLNSLLWKLGDKIMCKSLLPKINNLRQQEGLIPIKSVLKEGFLSTFLNLAAISPILSPPSPDLPQNYSICGFFNIPEHGEKWNMPDSLKEFLKAGSPPVYITFGSMLSIDSDPEEITGLLVNAANIAGCRTIIQSEWNKCKGIPEYPHIYRITQAPHQYIFPECSVVVHHGGAGTTQSATLHGCPSVVVEHLTDQALWGNALLRADIGGNLLHRRTVTAQKLANEIKRVLNNAQMKEKAKKLGEIMKKENGVKSAVEIIEKFCYSS